ncbi:MAG: hypothetical protein ACRDF4_00055, partial [Rhabdochlamydiaceae bacterium]
KAWVAKYEEIPRECLPRTDVSFKTGTTREIENRKADQIGIRLHILTEEYTTLKNTKLPATFQEYISSTAHKVEADRRQDETHLRPDYPEKDWTGLEITRMGLGSFDLECVSNDNRNIDSLTKACELFSKLVREPSDLKVLEKEMGKDGFLFAIALLKFVRNFDLALSIKWISKDNPNGFLPIDKKRAERVLDLFEPRLSPQKQVETQREIESKSGGQSVVTIEMNEDEIKPIRKVTLRLSPMEAELVRKEANGTGGMQSLLRELQKQLKEDNTITLTPYQVQRILKYTSNYGQGGFQGRLLGLARALRRISTTLGEA